MSANPTGNDTNIAIEPTLMEKFLAGVMAAAKETNTLSPEELQQKLDEIFDGVMGPIRPLIAKFLDLVPPKVGAELKPLLLAVLKVRKSVYADDDVNAILEEIETLKAARRMKAVKAYMKAGFSKAEAISFKLADIAALQSMVKQAGNTATSASKSK